MDGPDRVVIAWDAASTVFEQASWWWNIVSYHDLDGSPKWSQGAFLNLRDRYTRTCDLIALPDGRYFHLFEQDRTFSGVRPGTGGFALAGHLRSGNEVSLSNDTCIGGVILGDGRLVVAMGSNVGEPHRPDGGFLLVLVDPDHGVVPHTTEQVVPTVQSVLEHRLWGDTGAFLERMSPALDGERIVGIGRRDDHPVIWKLDLSVEAWEYIREWESTPLSTTGELTDLVRVGDAHWILETGSVIRVWRVDESGVPQVSAAMDPPSADRWVARRLIVRDGHPVVLGEVTHEVTGEGVLFVAWFDGADWTIRAVSERLLHPTAEDLKWLPDGTVAMLGHGRALPAGLERPVYSRWNPACSNPWPDSLASEWAKPQP